MIACDGKPAIIQRQYDSVPNCCHPHMDHFFQWFSHVAISCLTDVITAGAKSLPKGNNPIGNRGLEDSFARSCSRLCRNCKVCRQGQQAQPASPGTVRNRIWCPLRLVAVEASSCSTCMAVPSRALSPWRRPAYRIAACEKSIPAHSTST